VSRSAPPIPLPPPPPPAPDEELDEDPDEDEDDDVVFSPGSGPQLDAEKPRASERVTRVVVRASDRRMIG